MYINKQQKWRRRRYHRIVNYLFKRKLPAEKNLAQKSDSKSTDKIGLRNPFYWVFALCLYPYMCSDALQDYL